MGIPLSIDVDPRDKVSKIKRKYMDYLRGINKYLEFEPMGVVFQGKILDDSSTLEDNFISCDSSIIFGRPSSSTSILHRPSILSTVSQRPQKGGGGGGLSTVSQRPQKGGGGGGGGGLSPIPDSWFRILLYVSIVAAVLISVTYSDILRRVPPVPIPVPPIPVPVPPAPIPVPTAPAPDEDDEEDDEEYVDFTFALQWPRSYVLNKDRRKSQFYLVPDDRATVHGLWPDFKKTKNTKDFDYTMGGNKELIKRASENWPNLIDRSSDNLKNHNLKFWAKEWDGHGRYSGLSQQDYMNLAQLNGWLRSVIEPNGASTSSSTRPSSSKPRVSNKPILLNTHELEQMLTDSFARPKIVCRTPPGHDDEIFYSVYLKVRVKVTEGKPELPVAFVDKFAEFNCKELVILP